ncbi:MAG: 3-deoxy-D-manno-octulosonic acid transferase [Candidatus Cloacimonadales bacterium]|nr:3-deoxy-D-manno-octulosonic acid transferase [Candidatus Cloacimonadales bacterium]
MIIYRFISWLVFVISVPFLFLKFKGRERKERFGKTKHRFEKCVWIHAASVGEVNAVKTLINELLNKYNHTDFLLSTMTKTGQETAKSVSPKLTTVFLPFDVGFIMKRLFKSINPTLIILVETEFWPNMLRIAKKRKIPVVIVNGRISDRSFPKYKNLRIFWKPVWKAVNAVNAQSEKDAQKFKTLKFNDVVNAHNLKFCIDQPRYDKNKLRKELGYSKTDFVLVWGSSRPKEEKLLLKILPELKKTIPKLKVIIVPRHLHRNPELKELLKNHDYKLYSELKDVPEILLVNEMGILNTFYALADLAIVGGSFFNYGGHNPLEPAFYGTPMIIGNYYTSCRDSVDRLLENNGIIVSNKDILNDDILKLYGEMTKTKQMGMNAKHTLENNADSLKMHLERLEKYIK